MNVCEGGGGRGAGVCDFFYYESKFKIFFRGGEEVAGEGGGGGRVSEFFYTESKS